MQRWTCNIYKSDCRKTFKDYNNSILLNLEKWQLLPHYWSDKRFQGYCCESSIAIFAITPTVPLSFKISKLWMFELRQIKIHNLCEMFQHFSQLLVSFLHIMEISTRNRINKTLKRKKRVDGTYFNQNSNLFKSKISNIEHMKSRNCEIFKCQIYRSKIKPAIFMPFITFTIFFYLFTSLISFIRPRKTKKILVQSLRAFFYSNISKVPVGGYMYL